MRSIIIIFLFACALSVKGQTASVKTDTFTVNGNCEECKEVIENAADIKGVKLTKWDPDTKVAKVTYDPSKVALSDIQKAIAAKGYDAAGYKGDNKAYSKLPKCCKYRDAKCVELKK
jgi:periplasmic mercuric ion binding protein